jgi:hypothetical protein
VAHSLVKYTAPVWVHVEDGKVTRVVVEDTELTGPLGFVDATTEAMANGWTDEDLRPLTPEVKADLETAEATGWTGWEFGW